MQSHDTGENSQSIAATVKDLMDRKGVPERQKSKTLAEILNLSYSQAHRKLNTGVDWTIAQLQAVAEHFDESLASIGLGEGFASLEAPTDGELKTGIFTVAPGEHEFACRIWVGQQLHTVRKVDFVAYEDDIQWRAVAADMCPSSVVRYRIHRLEIIVGQEVMPTVAVIDDERDFADNTCEYLNESGFKATPFYDIQSIEQALQKRTFDGYVVDWIMGNRTAESLIQRIRLDSPQAPVFLLTGEVTTGKVGESELARLIMELDVQCREKPVRMYTFTAELLKAVGI